MSLVAGFFSIFALATLSTIPVEDANALNCNQVDASSNGQCDIDRDISEEGFRDCVNNVNCFATQTVNVQNTLRSSEEAKIHLDLEQYLNCGDPDCLNVFGDQEAINDATQVVDVISGGSSIVDFDVDAHMDQRSDGEGQRPVFQNNFGTQEFLISAANNAIVDADGDDNDVEFRMNQLNDQCDNSACGNNAIQTYDIVAQGTSRVDLSSNTGFTVNQLNNGCDDFDGPTNDVACLNSSTQELNINTANPTSTTTNRATVIYDTLGPTTIEQTTDCVQNKLQFGEISCQNTAGSSVNIVATGTSRVDMDDIEQDISQSADCDNGIDMFCVNSAALNVEAQAASDGVINVDHGSQTATQSISCDDGNADCLNIAVMEVGLFGVEENCDENCINPVTGTLNINYNQEVTQIADCKDATCTNNAIMAYHATAEDSAIVNSNSNQEIIQIADCADGQVCNNNALMTNDVFASGTARLYADSTQSLTQVCTTAQTNCNNNNVVTVSGTALTNAILGYNTNQDVFNGPGGSGTQVTSSIDISRASQSVQPVVTSSGPGNDYTITRTR